MNKSGHTWMRQVIHGTRQPSAGALLSLPLRILAQFFSSFLHHSYFSFLLSCLFPWLFCLGRMTQVTYENEYTQMSPSGLPARIFLKKKNKIEKKEIKKLWIAKVTRVACGVERLTHISRCASCSRWYHTQEWVMSHRNESRHTVMSHVTQ